MFCLLALVDPSLGKIDKDSLSQQTLMELLIGDIINKRDICRDEVSPSDVSDWMGVTLNSSNEITDIQWGCKDVRGSIDLRWIPSSVLRMEIANSVFDDCVVYGTLILTVLPEGLLSLCLSYNAFSGSIDLTHLPPTMVDLDLAHNALSGTLDFTQLPKTLKELLLNANEFEGLTDFSQLPDTLWHFDVSETNLSGEISARHKIVVFSVDGSGVKIVGREFDDDLLE